MNFSQTEREERRGICERRGWESEGGAGKRHCRRAVRSYREERGRAEEGEEREDHTATSPPLTAPCHVAVQPCRRRGVVVLNPRRRYYRLGQPRESEKETREPTVEKGEMPPLYQSPSSPPSRSFHGRRR
ncbi:uncharacterized protein DS421_14g475720 [Arachis hypogaea]|nr:uncharacterized protein DS421_14g475720 [Arachis hypogaea]